MLGHRLQHWPNIKPTLCQCMSCQIQPPFLSEVDYYMYNMPGMSSPWIWKGVSATLQSGRYTLSYPRGWCVFHAFIPLTPTLLNLIVQPLKVVYRWRHPQLKVSENDWDLTKWRWTILKSCWFMSRFSTFKNWYLKLHNCSVYFDKPKMYNTIIDTPSSIMK